VAQVLRGSSIFALPSHYEGLGCAYLEAMATGLPAIACRGQGIQEVIRHGENGFLLKEQVAERAVHELADTLRILLKNPELRRMMGVAARQTVVESYTLRHQAQGLLRAYLPICRGSLA
jgi:glycosyltransferase involved in cell wall biosynthesis